MSNKSWNEELIIVLVDKNGELTEEGEMLVGDLVNQSMGFITAAGRDPAEVRKEMIESMMKGLDELE